MLLVVAAVAMARFSLYTGAIMDRLDCAVKINWLKLFILTRTYKARESTNQMISSEEAAMEDNGEK